MSKVLTVGLNTDNPTIATYEKRTNTANGYILYIWNDKKLKKFSIFNYRVIAIFKLKKLK